jgi:hypothetical protein
MRRLSVPLLLAVLLALPARAAPRFGAGLGIGFGGGPDDTGEFGSGTLFIDFAALSWLDLRLGFLRFSNNLFNFIGEGPELRANAGLFELHVHGAIAGPVELAATGGAGLGSISEPLPLVFGSKSGRRADLAWLYGAGPRFALSPNAWSTLEWVATQFAHYPKTDRLAYREGRLDGPMLSIGAKFF